MKEKLGTLAELFGHLTSASGDLATNHGVFHRPVPSTLAARLFLEELDRQDEWLSDKLPSIEEIERVWYETQPRDG